MLKVRGVERIFGTIARVRAPLIAVCGTSTASPGEAAAAARVGELLAELGATVVCGGLGGVMEAVAQGVDRAGGMAVGLLPGDDPDAAAAELRVAIPTGLGELRNGLIARACRGMIAIGGGYGTLSEIGFMLRLGRPVAGLATWDIRDPSSQVRDPAVFWAANADDAVEWLWHAVAHPE